jgi:hypothetical protein
MSDHANYINHVVLVLDASWSMTPHARNLITVADGEIQHLARRSQELDQETRVSIYDFADDVRCLIYDKDVLRLPSIAKLYEPRGNTALIDATIKSLDDLAQTAQLYGDHAFLGYVMTDGEENASRGRPAEKRDRLQHKLASLPQHWTVACLVPDQRGKFEAQGFGFAPANIAIWNPDARTGIEEAGAVIRKATESFMVNRTRGVRGTTSLFSTGTDTVNAATVQATLVPLPTAAYEVLAVGADAYVELFVRSTGRTLVRGSAYYQLTKTETIQRGKQVVVREKATSRFFAGTSARQLIGLPDIDVRVRPDYNPDFEIFVQSTSTNRKLIKGTDLLLMR